MYMNDRKDCIFAHLTAYNETFHRHILLNWLLRGCIVLYCKHQNSYHEIKSIYNTTYRNIILSIIH